MNVKFQFGNESQLPNSAEDGALLFTETGKIYRGVGEGLPLIDFGSALYGYTDLADLQAKNPAVIGKLYLTNDAKLYSFNAGVYSMISGATNASAVSFDKLTSTLTSTDVNTAIIELDTKISNIKKLSKNTIVFYTNKVYLGDNGTRGKVPYNANLISIETILANPSQTDLSYRVEKSTDGINFITAGIPVTVEAGNVVKYNELNNTVNDTDILRVVALTENEEVLGLTINLVIEEV